MPNPLPSSSLPPSSPTMQLGSKTKRVVSGLVGAVKRTLSLPRKGKECEETPSYKADAAALATAADCQVKKTGAVVDTSLRDASPASPTTQTTKPAAVAPAPAPTRALPAPGPCPADWADGLPPDFLEGLARVLGDGCRDAESSWADVQAVYAAASVCRRWREAVNHANFRSCARDVARGDEGEALKPLTASRLCHPSQLLERYATGEEIVRCYVLRDRPRTGLVHGRRYTLVLGSDYEAGTGKRLLVASHQIAATKSLYNVYLHPSEAAAGKVSRRLGQLSSSPYGTLFELYAAQSHASVGPLKRKKSGHIRYSFNMIGGRGPRSVRVDMSAAAASDDGGVPAARPRLGTTRRCLSEACLPLGRGGGEYAPAAPLASKDVGGLLFENKLPRWHDMLQCWCLDFGGRVKCASVKNFQLVTRGEQEDVILQFGKVDCDTFTMDFRPASLSALHAFMICLSSFDAKLSCF